MEADFMEPRVQYLDNVKVACRLFALLVCFSACQERVPTQLDVMDQLVPDSVVLLNPTDGLLYQQDKLFDGSVYHLFSNEKDTEWVHGYKQGYEHGLWRHYDSSGRLLMERMYDRGKKVGLLQTWWPNGKRQWLYHFKDDEYEGECMEWNEQGRMIRQMHYQSGQEQGSQKTWYDNGKIKANYWVESGRRYGLLGTKNCVNVSDSLYK